MTKGITIATAKAVAAGNSAQQEDVIATANLSRKAISDMLTTCKVLIQPALPKQASRRQHQAAREHVSPACWEQIMQSLVYFMAAPAGRDSSLFSKLCSEASDRASFSTSCRALVTRQKQIPEHWCGCFVCIKASKNKILKIFLSAWIFTDRQCTAHLQK